MSSSKYKRERKAMLGIFERMRLGEEEENAASPTSSSRQRRNGKYKRKLLPSWQKYIHDVWMPQEQARIAEATNRDAAHEVEQSVKDGVNIPAYDFADDVALHRAKAFFHWLQSEGVQRDESSKGTTAHWPRKWEDVVGHLEEEKAGQILRAKSSSKRKRRGAIKNLLVGGMSLSQLNAMGIGTRGLKGL